MSTIIKQKDIKIIKESKPILSNEIMLDAKIKCKKLTTHVSKK